MCRMIVLIILVMGFLKVDAKTNLSRNRERVELNMGSGITHYNGDIGSAISKPGTSFFLGGRYYFTPRNSFKFNLFHLTLKGNDIYDQNLIERGYSFTTPLTEISAQMDFFLFKVAKGLGSPKYDRRKKRSWNLYFNYGFGYAFFKPQNNLMYDDIDQSYDRRELVLPIGCGVRFLINRKWNVDLDVSKRITTTDFLDGFGVLSSKDDSYSLFQINIGYRLSR